MIRTHLLLAALALSWLTACPPTPAPSSGEGEGEGAAAGEGEGAASEGEGASSSGEGEGVAGEGEGEGEGEGAGGGQATWSAAYALMVGRCDGCHAPGSNSGNLDLSSQQTAYEQLVGVVSDGPFCGQSPHTRVIAGDPDNSLLYQKLAGTQDCGLSMPEHEPIGPPGPGPFSADELQLVHDWIAAGALNN